MDNEKKEILNLIQEAEKNNDFERVEELKMELSELEENFND